jgi:DNA-binding transcriptional regulator YiaG
MKCTKTRVGHVKVRQPGQKRPRSVSAAAHGRRLFGQTLKRLRESLKVSVGGLARKLGWLPGDVEEIESGRMSPSAGQKADLAKWHAELKKGQEIRKQLMAPLRRES